MKQMSVDDVVHDQVKTKCAEFGITILELMNFLCQEWLQGRVKYEAK